MSYRVDDITWDKCPEDTFTNAKGEAVSYVDYYRNQYNIEIQDHKQPLLISRSRHKGLSEQEVDQAIQDMNDIEVIITLFQYWCTAT